MLTLANGVDATGIIAGTGGVTSTRDLEIDAKDILRGWEDLARAHNAEFEIDPEGTLNFVPSLGTDQSTVITLSLHRDGEAGGNLNDVEEGEDGSEMVNKVIATTTGGGGLTSTQEDLTSQATYGILVERKQFNEAQDQTTLDAMALSYVTQRANPITDFRVEPQMASRKFDIATGTQALSGLQYEDIGLGDLVSVEISTEGSTLSTTAQDRGDRG